jgi:hypothetical protein
MAARDCSLNSLIDLLVDDGVIDMMASLIAKLQRVAIDDGRNGVCRTKWASDLLNELTSRMMGCDFDVERWYSSVVSSNGTTRSRRGGSAPDPALYTSSIDTDWFSALAELEIKASAACAPGEKRRSVLRLMHSILEIEDRAHSKLASYCKKERQYDLMGINRIAPQKLLAAAPSAPEAGSPEDLIAKTRPKKNS